MRCSVPFLCLAGKGRLPKCPVLRVLPIFWVKNTCKRVAAGRVDAQKRRERTHYRLLLIWIITDVLPLLVLQLYGMFWSSVPRPHSTFALLSLATSVYMDTLPFVFVIVWGMSAMDVVALNWPKSKQR